MRDFKYREAATARIPHWGWQMTNFVLSDSLRPILEAFRWSMQRTSNLLHMPAWIAFEATREQLWLDYVRAKFNAPLNPNLEQYASATQTVEMEEEFDRLVLQFRKGAEETVVKLFNEIGIGFIEHKLTHSKAVVEGLTTMYESVILDSWSAFEVLIRDLWVKTLDENKTLSTQVYASGKLRKASKNITLTSDISNYGSLVVELRQASFQNLDDIITFYDAAFGEEAVKLFDTIEDGYIKVLNAFRNVLMHNRGRLDLGFRVQAREFPQFYKGIADGTELLLDGVQVTKMRAAAMELGKELIQLADRTLPRNAI